MNNIFYKNIETETLKNTNYRNVLYTSKNQQIVLMSLKPLDNIPMEIHKEHDQFIRIEKGEGEGLAIINNIEYKLHDGIAIIIPAGIYHKIINMSLTNLLQLYTIYSSPEHKQGLYQAFKHMV